MKKNKKHIEFSFKVVDDVRNMVVVIDKEEYKIPRNSNLFRVLTQIIEDYRQKDQEDEIFDNDIAYCNSILAVLSVPDRTSVFVHSNRALFYVHKQEKLRCNINVIEPHQWFWCWCYK